MKKNRRYFVEVLAHTVLVGRTIRLRCKIFDKILGEYLPYRFPTRKSAKRFCDSENKKYREKLKNS